MSPLPKDLTQPTLTSTTSSVSSSLSFLFSLSFPSSPSFLCLSSFSSCFLSTPERILRVKAVQRLVQGV